MACVAYGCKSRSNVKSDEDKNLSFHRFPANEKFKDVWVKVVQRKKLKTFSAMLKESNYYLDGKKRKVLCRDAVPTIFKSYPTYLQKESVIQKQIKTEIQKQIKTEMKSYSPRENFDVSKNFNLV